MTALVVGRNKFRVQFRHLSKLTKRPTLYKAPMDVLTTCVIAMETMDDDGNWNFRGMAIGHAMCDRSDNFNKGFARDTSFSRAVSDCALFNDVKAALMSEYEQAKTRKTTKPKSKYSVRNRMIIADFLRQFAEEVGSTPEQTAVIAEAAAVIKSSGAPSKVGLSNAEREERIAAGSAIRQRRSTSEGRASVNAEKRAKRCGKEIPRAAG